jgi:hydroxymethylglutaryl-CoA lyase
MNTADNIVILEEQGLRDGFQTLSTHVPTALKLELVQKLVDAGLRRIQVAAFVHPKLVPQMADAEAVVAALPKFSGVIFSGLVLNLKGIERAASTNLKHLAVSISASETHSLKNTRKTLAEAQTEFKEMVELAHTHKIRVRGGIQCAFGCRFEGKISENRVLKLVESHLRVGVDELALADSTGMANPLALRRLMTEVKDLAGKIPVALHLHNTENKGLANVYAALEAGIRQFDTAFGGLGGCPFIQSATGNIATEDTAHMLHQMGFQTGINLEKMAEVSAEFEKFLNAPLEGMLYKLVRNKEIKLN